MKTSSPKKAQDFNVVFAIRATHSVITMRLPFREIATLRSQWHSTSYGMEQFFVNWKVIAHLTYALYSIPCNALFVIASGNKGTPRDTVYPWGKGINKQKTSIFAFCVKWLVKSTVYDAWQSPGRDTLLSDGSDMPSAWYLPFGQVMDKYLNFGWKPKYNFDEVKI